MIARSAICPVATLSSRFVGRCAPALLAALLASQAGCRGALVGRWFLTDVAPSRQEFAIDNATFHQDGSFLADVTIDGKTIRELGTFDFNGVRLTLRPAAGGQRKFEASLVIDRLELTDAKRKVVLERRR
ncbi:MAG: hypothetical protein CHACPFDD_00121 [Phycisphaerae bacterium]|nr:hypothetical protein [Phycisphaerae bacterium]